MTWNYQALEDPGGVRIIEVYHDDDGAIMGWIHAQAHGSTLAEIVTDLRLMELDALTRPVLTLADLPKDGPVPSLTK